MNPQPAFAATDPPAMAARVFDLDHRRIVQALAGRSRYKYVHPRVVSAAEGAGWQVFSPNCSRNVEPAGGEIAIAWFEPVEDGRWRLLARDHVSACWVVHAEDLTLPQALALVREDPAREFWV